MVRWGEEGRGEEKREEERCSVRMGEERRRGNRRGEKGRGEEMWSEEGWGEEKSSVVKRGKGQTGAMVFGKETVGIFVLSVVFWRPPNCDKVWTVSSYTAIILCMHNRTLMSKMCKASEPPPYPSRTSYIQSCCQTFLLFLACELLMLILIYTGIINI